MLFRSLLAAQSIICRGMCSFGNVAGLTRPSKSANHRAESLLAAPQLLIALYWSSPIDGLDLNQPSRHALWLRIRCVHRKAITVMHSSLYRSTVLRVFRAVCSGCQDRNHPPLLEMQLGTRNLPVFTLQAWRVAGCFLTTPPMRWDQLPETNVA